jgi:Family of unknown function (DUF6295)
VCTYVTEHVALNACGGKSPLGWIDVTEATVYYDHPVHAPLDHAVNIDFRNPSTGAAARVAVELSLDSARALIAALQATVERAAQHG